MTVLFIVFALALAACGSQESVTAPVQSHPQAAKTGEAAVSEGSATTDRAVLVAFYVATTGRRDWDNWLCEVSLDQWAGVTTDENGRVTGLDLGYNHLSGSIPPELGNLKNLQSLDLSDNHLSGSIPPELGNLKNLQSLNLSYNDLSGPIPPELGNLKNLQYLNLDNNHLRGFIPPELGNLENLQSLRLFYNQLRGAIPPELGNLENLQSLTFQANGLCGPIPPELGNLSSLQSLNLFANQLTGEIPSELGNLKNLQRLDLSDNQLSGPIPPELGNLDSLQSLNLSGNQLSGCIPSALLNFVSWLPGCGDEPEPVAEMPEPATELTPEIVGLYGTLVSTFTNIFFAALVPGTTSVPGEGGGSVEISGNDWTLQDYSPDGTLIANGTLNVGLDQTPIPLTGEVILSGSHEAELILNMELSVGTGGLSATGTIIINGAEFDVAEVSAAAAAAEVSTNDPGYVDAWVGEYEGTGDFALSNGVSGEDRPVSISIVRGTPKKVTVTATLIYGEGRNDFI